MQTKTAVLPTPTTLVRTGLVLVALALALLGVTGAQAGAITVQGEDVTVGPGAAFDFAVTGHSETPIGAFGISITFDEDVVTPQSCQSSIALCNKGASDGELRLNGVSLAGYSGDITFATIVFEAADSGASAIDIEVTAMADTDSHDIEGDVVVTDGSVTIDDGAMSTPPGDANCDSVVNAADGLAVLSQLAGAGDSGCFSLADVNCDDKVNTADALAILRQIGGLDVTLPAGCSPVA